jgi:hypothetical protein
MAATILLSGCVPESKPISTASQVCDSRFILRNNSGLTINEFYTGPSSQQHWGRDRLGDGVMPAGRVLRYPPSGGGTVHDFRVVFENGRAAELRRVNLCRTTEIVANRNGLEAR